MAAKKKRTYSFRAKDRDPEGGLTPEGRRAYNAATGSELKKGVTGRADTPDEIRRKGSFLSRMFGPGAPGRMRDEKGRPTRRALSAAAWGERVPKNDADRQALYEKGQRLLARYKRLKEEKAARKARRGGKSS
jgi:hypothetical protein